MEMYDTVTDNRPSPRCTNCGSGVSPNTTHQPATDEIGGGICVVTYHNPGEMAYQSVPPLTFTEHVTQCLDNSAAAVREWKACDGTTARCTNNCMGKCCRTGQPLPNNRRIPGNKPHLRLRYITSPLLYHIGNPYPWCVEMVRDPRPSYGPLSRVTTHNHCDAAGALKAARIFWWSDC